MTADEPTPQQTSHEAQEPAPAAEAADRSTHTSPTAQSAPEPKPAVPITVVEDASDRANGLVILRHAAVDLALHRLREARPGAEDHRPLLCLEGLGEAVGTQARPEVSAWPGAIWGLDLTGHGASTVPGCGGYTAEILVADVDHALGYLGEATIAGRGLGAYVALLAAGARPDLVTGAILLDGPGIDGGGPSAHSSMVLDPVPEVRSSTAPDPFALIELSTDVRPPDYAAVYARQALEFSGLPTPIMVAAVVRPPWLEAVASEPGVVTTDPHDALRRAADQTR